LSSESVSISQRNFDPLTRTLRKRDRADAENEDDTVEKDVSGLAQEIIAGHEEQRAQELVGHLHICVIVVEFEPFVRTLST
jgi:coiled-coil domain-containing protein 12